MTDNPQVHRATRWEHWGHGGDTGGRKRTGKSNSPGMYVVGEPETALQNLVHYEERRYPESSVEDAECLSREIHGWEGQEATGGRSAKGSWRRHSVGRLASTLLFVYTLE